MTEMIDQFVAFLSAWITGFFYIIAQFFGWLGNFITINPWASIAFFVIVLVAAFPATRFAIRNQLRALGIKRLKISDAEIEFSREDRLTVERSLAESIEIINQYRIKADKNIDRLIQKYGLVEAFTEASAAIFESSFGNRFGISKMRSTIHSQDFVFSDRLYQITNYYPEGGGIHRDFSLRRGIIGRVWRSQKAACAGFLIHRLAPNPLPSDEELINGICLEWGLTDTEAYDFKKKPSYCCVPIRHGYRLLAVFYLDCESNNFGWNGDDDLDAKLEQLKDNCAVELKKKNLPEILLNIEKEMADFAPRASVDVQ